jgi:hypothetical protein
LCGALSAVAIAFVIGYDVLVQHAKHKYTAPQDDDNPPSADTASQKAAEAAEQSGDKERATLVLTYQLVVDALLVAVLAVESALDNLDWLGDDTLKKMYKVDHSSLQLYVAPNVEPPAGVKPNWWNDWGSVSFGCLGAVAAIEAEILAVGSEFAG